MRGWLGVGQLVEVINEDYNDFISLSTKLVNVDGAVMRMQKPLLEVKVGASPASETALGPQEAALLPLLAIYMKESCLRPYILMPQNVNSPFPLIAFPFVFPLLCPCFPLCFPLRDSGTFDTPSEKTALDIAFSCQVIDHELRFCPFHFTPRYPLESLRHLGYTFKEASQIY